MITLEKARRIVLKHAVFKIIKKLNISDCFFKVLAQDVYSLKNSPSFDKSIMDGFALVRSDIRKVPVELKIVESIFAGCVPRRKVVSGACAAIATGALLPRGADAVVKKEDSLSLDFKRVRILKKIAPHANISFKAENFKKGCLLLKKGTVLNTARIALLASQGFKKISVYTAPSVALLATGCEIKEAGSRLKQGQVWDVITPMLMAALRALGIGPVYLGRVGDDEALLYKKIKEGLKYDVLITCGAVSVGTRDLIPSVLKKAHFSTLVHKVAIRPGKPFLFAVRPRHLAFGLPGNPLASLVGFYLFVRPALQKILKADSSLSLEEGILRKGVYNNSQRLSFLPARLAPAKDSVGVVPIKYSGSADVWAAAKADVFLVVPRNKTFLKRGQRIKYLKFST
jgi:molybdopterin molybdotransferase